MAIKKFGMGELAKLRAKAARLQNATKRVREKAGEVVNNVVRTGEVSASAFAFGYAQQRFGREKMEVGGLHLALLGGTAAHVLSFMGISDGAEPHLRAIGDGALATYFFTLGRDVAVKTKTAGYGQLNEHPDDDVSGQMLSDEELSRIMRY